MEFGDYANPSFESQIETVGKAKSSAIMSNEAVVDELYGDTKTEEWKQEEINRLNARDGVETMEEPALNVDGLEVEPNAGTAESFIEGGMSSESQGKSKDVRDVPEGVSQTP